jgi:hypothetical protein
MSNEEKTKAFFESLSEKMDIAFGAFEKVYEFVDKWEETAVTMAAQYDQAHGGKDEKPAEKANLEPSITQMARDIHHYRTKILKHPSTPWAQYVDGKEMLDGDNEYTRKVWSILPEEAKTYLKRKPGSPL